MSAGVSVDISDRACQVTRTLVYGPFFTVFPFSTFLLLPSSLLFASGLQVGLQTSLPPLHRAGRIGPTRPADVDLGRKMRMSGCFLPDRLDASRKLVYI